MFLNEVRQAIVEWYSSHGIDAHFGHLYVFGSLVNRGGKMFLPSGIISSDIDVIPVFRQDADDYSARVAACKSLRESVTDLEHKTAMVLGRSDLGECIYSILPMTQFEIYHSIHKGFDPKIFTTNIFYDVLAGETRREGLVDYVEFTYHYENVEAFAAIRLCQKIRNLYVKANGIGHFSLEPFSSEMDPAPKELMRTAALLAFLDTKQDRVEDRTDLLLGYGYITKILDSFSAKDASLEELSYKMKARSFERAIKGSLSPEEMLTICEVLYDQARSQIPRSVREAIDGAIEANAL